jgi:hypothetical protein
MRTREQINSAVRALRPHRAALAVVTATLVSHVRRDRAWEQPPGGLRLLVVVVPPRGQVRGELPRLLRLLPQAPPLSLLASAAARIQWMEAGRADAHDVDVGVELAAHLPGLITPADRDNEDGRARADREVLLLHHQQSGDVCRARLRRPGRGGICLSRLTLP